MMMRRRALPALATMLAMPAGGPARAQSGGVTVFAAASLTDALRALGQAWAARGHPAPRLSFAASSTLARQIEQGAPAELFLSADEAWADYLAERGLLVAETRGSPVGNALVLVGAADNAAAQPVALARGTDLLALLGPRGRIATGDPAHVPAGRYARDALRWMGQWDAVAPRLARGEEPEPSAPVMTPDDAEKRAFLRAFRAHVEANAESVGPRFAEEARRIHYGEAAARAIYGNAGEQDIRALIDEGVPIAPMPQLPDEQN